MPYLKSWGVDVTKSAPEPYLDADSQPGRKLPDIFGARCGCCRGGVYILELSHSSFSLLNVGARVVAGLLASVDAARLLGSVAYGGGYRPTNSHAVGSDQPVVQDRVCRGSRGVSPAYSHYS